MKLIHVTKLTDLQKSQTRELVALCRQKEPITLSAPSEDGLDYYLLYETAKERGAVPEKLIGFSFLFFAPAHDDDSGNGVVCECTSFVHPDHRRNGYFADMLNEALSAADDYEAAHDCQVDFCFVTDEKSPAALKVLETIGAEYWYTEYKMTRPLRDSDMEYIPGVTIKKAPDEEDSREQAELYTASLDGQIIGTCAVLPSGNEYYLFSFQIREDRQSQGCGKDFLKGMLAVLAAKNRAGCGPNAAASDAPPKPSAASEAASDAVSEAASPQPPSSVSVQVSGLNYIARNLYKKTGFRNTESLSYYLY